MNGTKMTNQLIRNKSATSGDQLVPMKQIFQQELSEPAVFYGYLLYKRRSTIPKI